MEKTAPSLQVYLQAETLEGNGIVGIGKGTINTGTEHPLSIKGVFVANAEAAEFPTSVSISPSDISAFSQIASLDKNFIPFTTAKQRISPVTVNKLGSQIALFKDAILQITPNQFGYIAERPFAMGKIAVDEFASNSNIGNLKTFTKNVFENCSREINSFQVNPSPTTQTDVRQDDTSKVSLSLLVQFE